MDAAEAVGKPTICLIKGACVGGGCEFSTACDIRIAADNARLGVPIARLGLPVGFREMRRLIRLIGHAKTMELLLTADLLPAQEAHQIGLVNHVVPLAEVDAFTYAMADKIAALAPVVHHVHKEIAQIVMDNPGLEDLTAAQQRLAVLPFDTEDFQEGWQAFSGQTDAAVSRPLMDCDPHGFTNHAIASVVYCGADAHHESYNRPYLVWRKVECFHQCGSEERQAWKDASSSRVLGAITPLGIHIDTIWQKLCHGVSGIDVITRFDTTDFSAHIAGEARDFTPDMYMEKRDIRRSDRFVHFALGASHEAMLDAGLMLTEANAHRVGVYIGTAFGGLASLEEVHTQLIHKGPQTRLSDVPRHGPGQSCHRTCVHALRRRRPQ